MSTHVVVEKTGALVQLKGVVEGDAFVLDIEVEADCDPHRVAMALAALIRLGAVYVEDTDPRYVLRTEATDALRGLARAEAGR